MKILTPALGWFIFGIVLMFMGFMLIASTSDSDDAETGLMFSWLFLSLGSCAALVGVIAKGVEVGINGTKAD